MMFEEIVREKIISLCLFIEKMREENIIDDTHRVLDDAAFVLGVAEALPKIPEPDWSQAPDASVMWWSVSTDGVVSWSIEEPYLDIERGQWVIYAGVVWSEYIEIPLYVDWRMLKQQRPVAKSKAITL